MQYVTAGESHGPALTAIVTGVPAGLKISADAINADLFRRQGGYGRGGRQEIEIDRVRITGGLRYGVTLGTPLCLSVENKDYDANKTLMDPTGHEPFEKKDQCLLLTPRPGHADLCGALKHDFQDCRNVSERASARETAARVAAAGIAREFLAQLDVDINSYVNSIGTAVYKDDPFSAHFSLNPFDVETSDVRCPDEEATAAMKECIDAAAKKGDTLGGTFRIVAFGLLPGIGGYEEPSKRLTAQLGGALFSIPGVKGVEFGLGFQAAHRKGSAVMDPILVKDSQFKRKTNNAGGLEGGMTTGAPLVITVACKPIPSLGKPLASVNLETLAPEKAPAIRSDVCAVPACAVVAEAEVAFVLANAYMDAFGCTNMTDIKAAMETYKQRIKAMAH